jgi:hypothetical protein
MRLLERRSTRAVGLTGLFVLLALAMIRPTRLDSFRENLGDPTLVTWMMAWPGRALVTDPTRVFQAPLYWPHPDTYGYSDILFTHSLPFWSFYGLTRSWTIATICVGLLLTVLAQLGAYLLAHRITGRRDAALVAAISFGFSGYALGRWASPQLATIGLMALALVALLRMLEAPSPWRGVVLGGATLAVFYGGLYYGALWLLLLAPTCAIVLVHRLVRRDRALPRLLMALTVAALISGIGILPTALLELRLQRNLHLTRPLSNEFDLFPRDLLRPAEGSYVWSRWLDADHAPNLYEHRFFPGAIPSVLGAVGVAWIGLRLARRRSLGPSTRPRAGADLGVVIAMGIVSLALAKGVSGVGAFAPWRFVHDHVPGFSGIRATSRLAVPGLLAGAVLAAVGYAALARRWLHSSAVAAVAIVAVVALLCLDLAAPGRWAKVDTSDAATGVYRELGRRPAGGVLELPIPDPATEAAYPYIEAPRVMYSMLDWHPRINGYSGYTPPGYNDEVAAYKQFPRQPALDRLRIDRVRYVVVHVGHENTIPAFTESEAQTIVAGLPPGASASRVGAAFLIDFG